MFITIISPLILFPFFICLHSPTSTSLSQNKHFISLLFFMIWASLRDGIFKHVSFMHLIFDFLYLSPHELHSCSFLDFDHDGLQHGDSLVLHDRHWWNLYVLWGPFDDRLLFFSLVFGELFRLPLWLFTAMESCLGEIFNDSGLLVSISVVV